MQCAMNLFAKHGIVKMITSVACARVQFIYYSSRIAQRIRENRGVTKPSRRGKKRSPFLYITSGPFARYLLELHVGRWGGGGGISGIMISIFRIATREMSRSATGRTGMQRDGTATNTSR